MVSRLLRLILALSLLLGALAPAMLPASAQDAPETAAPDPALTDPSIDPGELELRLIPLTRDDLAALAPVWLDIVKAKTQAVIDQQIAISRSDGADPEARATLDRLADERRRLFDDYTLVVDAWEKKGGDPDTIATYRTYRNSVIFEEKRTAGWEALLSQAVAWLTRSDGGVRLGLRIVAVVGSLVVLLAAARMVRRIARRALGRVPNLSKLLQAFLLMVLYWMVIAFGLMIVLSMLGVDITPVFALIGGASFIMAFALQDTLGNLAAGLMIMINRPFDEGDYVDIGGVAGTVQSVSIVSTKVTTPDNQVIVVPNSKAWGNVITNVTASATRRVDLTFGISYEDSIDKAQEVLEATVAAHPLVLKDPKPVIRVNALSASSVDFICRPWARSSDYWAVYWDLLRQVKINFDAAGISIPYPQQDLHVRVPPGAMHPALAAAAAGGRPDGARDFAAGDEGRDR